MEPDSTPNEGPSRDVVASHLTAHRARYSAFVRARVASAEVAEDLLQEAVARALTQAPSLRGAVEPWFFRMLRNAIVDHMRRRGASTRALQALEQELQHSSPDGGDTPTPCPCVLRLHKQLKSEYAEALEQVAINGVPVKDFAEQVGISATNAGVRVFRAREALRKTVVQTCGACAANGCSDCGCIAPQPQ